MPVFKQGICFRGPLCHRTCFCAADMWNESEYRISPMKPARLAVACLSTSFRSFAMSDWSAFLISWPVDAQETTNRGIHPRIRSAQWVRGMAG